MDDLAVDLKRLSREIESGFSPSYASLIRTPRLAARWWVAVGATLLLAAAAAVLWMFGPWRQDPAVARTLLILPMEVRGQAEGGDYVGRAFAEALAVNLAQSKNLNVLAVPEKGEIKAVGSIGLRPGGSWDRRWTAPDGFAHTRRRGGHG